MPVGTQVEVPKHTKVTAVAPTVHVENQGIVPTSKDCGSFKGKIVKDQCGAWSAAFHVRNPTSKLLENIALMSICPDQKGRVIAQPATPMLSMIAAAVTVAAAASTAPAGQAGVRPELVLAAGRPGPGRLELGQFGRVHQPVLTSGQDGADQPVGVVPAW